MHRDPDSYVASCSKHNYQKRGGAGVRTLQPRPLVRHSYRYGVKEAAEGSDDVTVKMKASAKPHTSR